GDGCVARIRIHEPPRRMVGYAACGFYRARDVRGLFNVGGFSERALYVRSLSVAVLCTRVVGVAGQPGWSRACVVRRQAGLVPCPASVLPGPADSSVSRPLPLYLLLLPRRILQGVLGGSTIVCRRGAPQELLG